MSRLQKFVEQGGYGERTGRTAYAFNASNLPEATKGLDWRPIAGFSPADEVLEDPNLKQVFEAALKHGYALVTPA
ncbi:hypothetical protein A5906_30755 [Bradyrhizobium sacchari]|uniref:Uncharacterized protein n=1 Tax=Bradyrhizobium sacchari TaxID=1399419 RepID=A0A560JS46_9BRAD|nr:hypothetical protein [Bradyrhizobium sacchari]OPY98938.1 hypothetical protein A5906_30755 [Bradyrhizobium sacchari]TWB60423.1 hypothetical protein FBZ94_104648 [Bradyrhizobium sacchari]TWB73767.1 hypothetical protein FBZ95_10517 [Bradyrhizobium sacchari]